VLGFTRRHVHAGNAISKNVSGLMYPYRKLFRRWEEGMGELRDLDRPLPTLLPAVLTGVAHSLKSRTLASACNVVDWS
jgi:hypothetical protein